MNVTIEAPLPVDEPVFGAGSNTTLSGRLQIENIPQTDVTLLDDWDLDGDSNAIGLALFGLILPLHFRRPELRLLLDLLVSLRSLSS